MERCQARLGARATTVLVHSPRTIHLRPSHTTGFATYLIGSQKITFTQGSICYITLLLIVNYRTTILMSAMHLIACLILRSAVWLAYSNESASHSLGYGGTWENL